MRAGVPASGFSEREGVLSTLPENAVHSALGTRPSMVAPVPKALGHPLPQPKDRVGPLLAHSASLGLLFLLNPNPPSPSPQCCLLGLWLYWRFGRNNLPRITKHLKIYIYLFRERGREEEEEREKHGYERDTLTRLPVILGPNLQPRHVT